MHVSYKDAVHEPSSHATELLSVLEAHPSNFKPIMFIYTDIDGGPDHRLTFLSVQSSLIALF